MTKLQIFVSYSQVSVFDASLTRPFNNWTPAHVAQGFSWRSGSAAFKTPSESGKYNVQILEGYTEIPISASSIRVIEVPFLVPDTGAIEVASISDGQRLKLVPGLYELRYEASSERTIRFVFMKEKEPRFSILRADPDLAPKYPLLEIAEPA